MKCFIVQGQQGKLLEQDIPTPSENECLVKVLRAGICNTDLEILKPLFKGYMGFNGVLGHEFLGVCETAPSSHSHLVGQRVVGDINLACGNLSECNTCACGGDRARNHCPTRTVLGILNKDGTYAQYLTLPAVNLHVVPECVSDENAVFTEPLAAACRIVEQGLIDGSRDKVAVLGDGKLGLLIAEVVGRHINDPTRAYLFGRHEPKMCLLSTEAHITTALSHDVESTHAGAFDVVIDATGSPTGLNTARTLCRPLGTLVLKSTCAVGDSFNTAPFVIDELRIVGSRCGPLPMALKLLEDGLDCTKLISGTFPFDQVEEAITLASEKGALKVQLIF